MDALELLKKRFVEKNAWFDLADQGVIKVTGADRLTFLNGQLTQDMTTLVNNQTLLCAYCNPKGRVIALFRAFNTDEALYLLTERSLIAGVIERLQTFVFRADAVFEEVSEQLRVLGVQDINLPSLFADKSDHYAIEGEAFLMRLPNSRCRGVVVCPVSFVAQFVSLSSLNHLPQGQLPDWDAMDILEGYPRVTQEGSERFVPQALNLDRLNGVSFTKGCYVGQEVVARMHYLGKSKQRMHPAMISSEPVVTGDVLKSATEGKVADIIFAQRHENESLAQVACAGAEQSISLQNGASICIGDYVYLADAPSLK